MFSDRTDAGRHLARLLDDLRAEDVVVVGLPRGGVPVAYEVARRLGAPLDVILVRKLGVPFQPELGMGAIGEGGVRVVNDAVVGQAGVTPSEVAAVERRERTELERRARRYRQGRERVPLAGRTVVVVDDGIATGSTARAACLAARAEGARRVVLAVPVAPTDWTSRLAGVTDRLVAVSTPRAFFGVGGSYRDFRQTSDDEVVAYLDRAAAHVRTPAGHGIDGLAERPVDRDVEIRLASARLTGRLTIPAGAGALVVFAHGSGSSRHSPRNRQVAAVLEAAGLATLLFDLLTEAEELQRANVFDIELLGGRLVDVTRWVRGEPGVDGLPIGYFGASTGAAAALHAAAICSEARAVVSRGGRPDLAGGSLAMVRVPTLLIVGGRDTTVLALNRQAQVRLRGPSRLEVVPGATHLYEEPGALDAVAGLARDWFVDHLVRRGGPEEG